jgi:F-type H+-transporting ATPase subunit b
MPIADTSNFLIPNATFFVELVAFVIVLAVIGKYALPILNQALKDRADKIESEITAAGEAQADAEAADAARRGALETARQQAREIVAQANETAERVRTDAQARGQEEYERIVSNADAEVALARQRAVEEAAAKMGELVLDVVERIICREVDAAAHRDLIDEAVAALNADAASGGNAASGAGSRS